VGTYKPVSFAIESDDEPAKEIFGKNPLGYVVITPRRFTVIFTAENVRSPGTVRAPGPGCP
jgi:hypothetical protein